MLVIGVERVSVIIPTRNEEKSLEVLLKSLKKQSHKDFEILVIDGGSTDRTAEVAERFGAKVVPEHGKYRSAANARNIGVKNSKSGIVAVLDADNEVNEDFIKEALKKFGKNVAAVRCSAAVKRDKLLRRIIAPSFEHKKSAFTPTPVFWKRDYLLKTGGWDPSLGFGEDRIFERNAEKFMRDHKLEIGYAPEAKVFSFLPSSLGELANQQRWYGRTILYFLRENKRIMEYKSLVKLGYPLVLLGVLSLAMGLQYSEIIFLLTLPSLIAILYRMLKAVRISAYGLLLPLVDIWAGFFFLIGFFERFFKKGARGRD